MTVAGAHGEIPTLEEFGARLALIRWKMGWNQKEAALACELPQNSWREWELSGRAPRNLVQVAGKISARTGVDLYWLLTGQPAGGGPGGSQSEGWGFEYLRVRDSEGAPISHIGHLAAA